ncbi:MULTISPECIES: glycosyltransferase family 2 protein [Gammaproteobacteria]|uniref:glycosyltransferase family 2 protein n=1 Tax=Gammaproteobacteria TaxID=1236 RepID=UPI001B322C2B|nr:MULTISPECIES: glycosyltransferase [Gammaproteobacteria]MBP4080596.1 glycosyltransferase [Aeromonas sp. MrichA-1]
MDKENHDISFSEQCALVSVLCLSFNHGKYLRCALDSIVMQETNFKYEVLVHDDASLDNSQEIISEYESKYPNKIKSLKRKNNVYSKGDLLSIWKFFAENANGKFYAFCEGDDYWCSKHKLQEQISALAMSDGCDLSFHPTTRLNTKTGNICGVYGNYDVDDNVNVGFIPFSLLGELFISSTIHISSIIVSASTFSMFYDFFIQHPWLDVGDYFIKLMSLSTGAVYLNESMSVYRESVTGSWTSNRNNNVPLQLLHCVKMLAASKDIMKLHNQKYHVLGHRHLQRYTLELHTLLYGIQEKSYTESFYSGLKRQIDCELENSSLKRIIYYGAGSIFNSIINFAGVNITIDKGVVMVIDNGNVVSKTPIEDYLFQFDDVIIITPLFRGWSIRDELMTNWAPSCHYIVLDDLLSVNFVNDTIFSSAKEYLRVGLKMESVSNLSMC